MRKRKVLDFPFLRILKSGQFLQVACEEMNDGYFGGG